MRLHGFIFAAAAVAVLGGTLVWALGTEEAQAVTHLAETDGLRFATAVPSEHGVLAPCVACHRVEARGPERSAPPLVGIVGAPVAAAPWFGYSPALARKGGTWSRAALDAYLANPVGEVPGTFKTLSPITDETTRNAILDALDRL
jgi:cytochrome c2